MEYNAHGIIVVHNHPSGDPAPSDADWRFTKQLKEASKFLEIRLLDHMILGIPSADCPKGFYSFEQEGYL
jgi:DNA repair protein RadC